METLLIELSGDQMNQLDELFSELKDKGAVIAQIYVDETMRVRLLDLDTTLRAQQAVGVIEPGTSFHVNGRDAHAALTPNVGSRDRVWMPFDSAPKDGKQFIAWNGEEMAILNQPPGCALGRWSKHKGEWCGAIVRFDNPTHWMPRPKTPNELSTKKGTK